MTLCLLHGFASSPSAWDAVCDSLVEPVMRPAIAGHGRPPPDVPRSFDAEVERLAAQIHEPVHLAGYSMGARLALGVALSRPDRVQRLTLVSCNPGIDGDARAGRLADDEAIARLLEEHGVSAFVERWEALDRFATQATLPRPVRSLQRARRLAQEARPLAAAMRTLGLAAMPNYRARLASLDVPTTLVAGARDAKFAALAREMATSIPDASLVVLEGVGHDPTLEAPSALAALLTPAEPARRRSFR